MTDHARDHELPERLAALNAFTHEARRWRRVSGLSEARADMFGQPIATGEPYYTRWRSVDPARHCLSEQSMRTVLEVLFFENPAAMSLARNICEQALAGDCGMSGEID